MALFVNPSAALSSSVEALLNVDNQIEQAKKDVSKLKEILLQSRDQGCWNETLSALNDIVQDGEIKKTVFVQVVTKLLDEGRFLEAESVAEQLSGIEQSAVFFTIVKDLIWKGKAEPAHHLAGRICVPVEKFEAFYLLSRLYTEAKNIDQYGICAEMCLVCADRVGDIKKRVSILQDFVCGFSNQWEYEQALRVVEKIPPDRKDFSYAMICRVYIEQADLKKALEIARKIENRQKKREYIKKIFEEETKEELWAMVQFSENALERVLACFYVADEDLPGLLQKELERILQTAYEIVDEEEKAEVLRLIVTVLLQTKFLEYTDQAYFVARSMPEGKEKEKAFKEIVGYFGRTEKYSEVKKIAEERGNDKKISKHLKDLCFEFKQKQAYATAYALAEYISDPDIRFSAYRELQD